MASPVRQITSKLLLTRTVVPLRATTVAIAVATYRVLSRLQWSEGISSRSAAELSRGCSYASRQRHWSGINMSQRRRQLLSSAYFFHQAGISSLASAGGHQCSEINMSTQRRHFFSQRRKQQASPPDLWAFYQDAIRSGPEWGGLYSGLFSVDRSTTPYLMAFFVRRLHSLVKNKMRDLLPKGVSIASSFDKKGRHIFVCNSPGLEISSNDDDDDEAPQLSVSMNLPAGLIKREDVYAHVDEDILLIGGRLHEDILLGSMELPPNCDNKASLQVQMQDGTLKVTIPTVVNAKDNNNKKKKNTGSSTLLSNILRRFGIAVQDSTQFPAMYFDRIYLRRRILTKRCRTITIYKKETAESIHMKTCLPGLEKMDSTSDGRLSVSLYMPGLEIQDVDSFLEFGVFFIEGKRGDEHYLQAMLMPQHVLHKQSHIVKREMQDGLYKATITHETIEDVKKSTFYDVK